MEKSKVAKFSKAAILASKQFSYSDKNVLEIVLDNDKVYSIKEVQKELENELKRKVR